MIAPSREKLRRFSHLLQVIGDEFGTDWLRRKCNRPQGRRGSHPIVPGWKEARSALDHCWRTGRLEMTFRIAAVLEFGAQLDIVRGLESYRTVIAPALKAADFEKREYEVFVGGAGVEDGLQVEFVEPSRLNASVIGSPESS